MLESVRVCSAEAREEEPTDGMGPHHAWLPHGPPEESEASRNVEPCFEITEEALPGGHLPRSSRGTRLEDWEGQGFFKVCA